MESGDVDESQTAEPLADGRLTDAGLVGEPASGDPFGDTPTDLAVAAGGAAHGAGTPTDGCGVVELDDLRDSVDKALGVDFELVPAAMLADLAPTMESLGNRVQALDAKFVEALDASGIWAARGHRNVTAMLASGNGHPAGSAARARRASRLPKMALVEAAFLAGDITTDHVRLLGELTERRWLAAFTEAEQYLVSSATDLSWREFAHVVEVWKSVADPNEPDLT